MREFLFSVGVSTILACGLIGLAAKPVRLAIFVSFLVSAAACYLFAFHEAAEHKNDFLGELALPTSMLDGGIMTFFATLFFWGIAHILSSDLTLKRNAFRRCSAVIAIIVSVAFAIVITYARNNH
jgi:hypothetical protein